MTFVTHEDGTVEYSPMDMNSLGQKLESKVFTQADGTVTITNTYLQADNSLDHHATKVYNAEEALLAFFDDTAYAEQTRQRLVHAMPGVASFLIGFTPADFAKDAADFLAGKWRRNE